MQVFGVKARRSKMNHRKPREEYPDRPNLRQRLLHLIREQTGSVEEFASRAGISGAALRSYLAGARAPSAPVLYLLWKKLRVSPSYLIAGVGPEVLPVPSAQLAQWSTDVCGGAQSGIYAANATLEYEVDVHSSLLKVIWEFCPAPKGKSRKLLWPGEAGLMAQFPLDQFPRGRDWSEHDGFRLDLRTEHGRAALGVKIKTGASPSALTEVAVTLDADSRKERRILFRTFRDIDSRFDPRHVRTLTFAARQDLTGAPGITAEFSNLHFLR